VDEVKEAVAKGSPVPVPKALRRGSVAEDEIAAMVSPSDSAEASVRVTPRKDGKADGKFFDNIFKKENKIPSAEEVSDSLNANVAESRMKRRNSFKDMKDAMRSSFKNLLETAGESKKKTEVEAGSLEVKTAPEGAEKEKEGFFEGIGKALGLTPKGEDKKELTKGGAEGQDNEETSWAKLAKDEDGKPQTRRREKSFGERLARTLSKENLGELLKKKTKEKGGGDAFDKELNDEELEAAAQQLEVAEESQWEKEVLGGGAATQEDFMAKDECITVDADDNVLGHAPKFDCHRFTPATPRGQLHRAFSVFLFDPKGRLLLQQRAAGKITFPGVWTNTCCSHQLHGQAPSELDDAAAVRAGVAMGAKRAAVRKLGHELGIPAAQVPLTQFKFLTRLHYYASDAVTHGPHTPWGEHEIDYVLFIQAKVDVTPNAEEVQAVRYVTPAELRTLLADPALRWSPWFRAILERWGWAWWADLRAALRTDKHVDRATIHRFDPPPEHRCSSGVSGVEDAAGAAATDPEKKQGGYGKIRVHEEGKLGQLLRLNEVASALWFKTAGGMRRNLAPANEDEEYCERMLAKVSRSFAAVILQLPGEMTMSILVFYLTLRALDTIEDDMLAFKDVKEKVRYLEEFHKTGLVDEGWRMGVPDVGEGDERDLLYNFARVARVYKTLNADARGVIADICERMGRGMGEFAAADLGQGTATLRDYDLYCHYVAGLVGEGLSRLFSASGKEAPEVAAQTTLANSMGLFLQKTNIIRDFLEDYVDGRAWWPREVWGKHAKATGLLGEFALPEYRGNALGCLNELVTDALGHAADCLAYMEKLRNPEVFRFCAIPQVMAIATLDKVYNNPDVFTGVAKIRKGLAVKMIVDTTSKSGLHHYFHSFAQRIKSRVPAEDPSATKTHEVCDLIITLTEKKASEFRRPGMMVAGLLMACLVIALSFILQAAGVLEEGFITFTEFGSGEIVLLVFIVVYMVAVGFFA